MTKITAHKHRLDVHPRWDTHVYCTICGWAVSARYFPARSCGLDTMIARDNATPAALARMDAATTKEAR
jgi:hypothetical protein